MSLVLSSKYWYFAGNRGRKFLGTKVKAKLESSLDRTDSHTDMVIESRLSCLETRVNAVETLGDNSRDQAVSCLLYTSDAADE